MIIHTIVLLFLLILIILNIKLFIIKNKKLELFNNYSDYSDYSDNVYAIRPPYKLAKFYNPKKLNPYKILKKNFLQFPIEGYQNNIEEFSNPLDFLFNKESSNDNVGFMETGLSKMMGNDNNNTTPITINNQFNIEDIEYPKDTEDKKYIKQMVNTIGNKNIPVINSKQKNIFTVNNNTDNADIENNNSDNNSNNSDNDIENNTQYKFYNNESCGGEDGFIYTGAFFSNSNGLLCNLESNINEFRKAVVKPILSNGKIDRIDVIDGGIGYNNPVIIIKTNDNITKEAKAVVDIMDDNNSIIIIDIIEPGEGYKNIPYIEIKNENNSCYLCKK